MRSREAVTLSRQAAYRRASSPRRARVVSAAGSRVAPLLDLQRTHGNAFVARVIQRKLSVSQPDDPYEREADRVAEAVTAAPVNALSTGALDRREEPGPSIQRMCSACEDEVDRQKGVEDEDELQPHPAPTGATVDRKTETDIRNLGGRGQPLMTSTRTEMESRLGHDFGAVRVHTDDHAAGLARSVNALAFTYGSHVVFGGGQYRPGTTDGKKLLAHELTHVIQQTGAGGRLSPRDPAEEA